MPLVSITPSPSLRLRPVTSFHFRARGVLLFNLSARFELHPNFSKNIAIYIAQSFIQQR